MVRRVFGVLILALAFSVPSLASRFGMGTDSFPSVAAFLSEAQFSLDAEVFHLTDRRLIGLLKEGLRRGVALRLILDPGQSRNRQSARELEAAGAQVRWMDTDAAKGQLMHVKAACADGRALLCGSANWTHSGMALNREAVAVLDDPGLALDFSHAFEKDWGEALSLWPKRRLKDEELQSLPDPEVYYQDQPRVRKRKH
jgi:phosphatidylserine/phosphatidylglycerophosphate/cardiolipin synthase-like enzyme